MYFGLPLTSELFIRHNKSARRRVVNALSSMSHCKSVSGVQSLSGRVFKPMGHNKELINNVHWH